MGRAPCCDKASVKKGPWSPEEDATLKSYIEEHGPVGNWIALPQKIGLRRCGKSCRLRWLNYLRPNIKHGGFSEEEDNIICSLYISIGSRWSIIAAQLPGRTDNDIKNYWNTKLKKKLLGKPRNKEHRSRRDGSKRESTNISPENECFSVVSGLASDWSEVPGGVNSLPFASINQSPSLIGDQATIRGLLAQLGGRLPLTREQELIPANTGFLQCLNDLIPPLSHYPFGRNTVPGYSQPLGDSITHAPTVLNHGIQDFSMSEIEYRGLQDLLDEPDTIDIYGTHGMANGSICSGGLGNGEGSNIVWEDISSHLADNGACPPLLCDYEAQSQTLGGGRGPHGYSLEESRLYVGHC